MGQFVEENAHLKTDLKKYKENFDAIDWSSVKDKPVDQEKVKRTKRHATTGLCGEIGMSTFDQKAYEENYDHIFNPEHAGSKDSNEG